MVVNFMSDITSRLNHPGNLGRVNLPITTGRPAPSASPPITETGKTFRQLFDASLSQTRKLTFSKHAQARVEQRGVELSAADLEKLEQAVGKAAEKGVTDSLVYMNNTVFIVNVPSRVVVTVVDSSDTQHNVFTNINGAVIL